MKASLKAVLARVMDAQPEIFLQNHEGYYHHRDISALIQALGDYQAAAINLAGYAGHDEDCLFNRVSDSVVPGSCSCGYSEASRALRDLIE